MKVFFLCFRDSFTPFFLRKYNKSLTVGKSIGYYFFWWFILGVFGIIAGILLTRNFSAFERVSPWLDKIPTFELVFANNQLVKTGFPVDPYIVKYENEEIGFISPSMTLADINTNQIGQGVYALKDGFIIVQNKGTGQKIQTGKYAEMNIGDKIINNAFGKEIIRQAYPTVRLQVIFVVVPILITILSVFVAIVHFILIFIWAGILRLICFIPSFSGLNYDQLVAFTFYTHFFDLVLTSTVFSLGGVWFSGLANIIVGLLISLVIFFGNFWFLKK